MSNPPARARTASPDNSLLAPGLGWQFFSGLMLLLVGIINLIDGLAGIVDSNHFNANLATNPGLPVTHRVVVWSWIVLIVGIGMIAVAFPVMAGLNHARTTGIVIASINLVLELAYLAHFPLWSVITIFLTVIIIFGLAAHPRQRLGVEGM